MEAVDPNEKTIPCKVCGRRFIKSSLVKHEPACKKLQKLSRKVFDSGKQRASNSDITIAAVKKAAKEKEKHGGVFPRPKTHWRERHQEFIGAVSGARHVEHALKTGGPLPPPPMTSFNKDYIKCDYCGRNFNQTAAERHIPFCREQAARTGARGPPTRAPPTRAPRTSSKPPTRSHSQPRNVSSRSPSESRSSSRRSSTKNSSPGSTSYGRAPPTGVSVKGASRPVAGSAGVTGTRTSHLPTPIKRSNSAPRHVHPPSGTPKTPGSGYSQRQAPTAGASRKSVPNAGTMNGRAPPTSKNPASTSGRHPSHGRR